MGDRAKGAMTDEMFDIVEQLQTYAEARGHELLTLATSWLAQNLMFQV